MLIWEHLPHLNFFEAWEWKLKKITSKMSLMIWKGVKMTKSSEASFPDSAYPTDVCQPPYFSCILIRRKNKVKETIFVTQNWKEKSVFKLSRFFLFMFRMRHRNKSQSNFFAHSKPQNARLNCRKCQIINDGICFSAECDSDAADDGISTQTNDSIRRPVDDILLVFRHCDRHNMCFIVIYWTRFSEKFLCFARLSIVITTWIYELKEMLKQNYECGIKNLSLSVIAAARYNLQFIPRFRHSPS